MRKIARNSRQQWFWLYQSAFWRRIWTTDEKKKLFYPLDAEFPFILWILMDFPAVGALIFVTLLDVWSFNENKTSSFCTNMPGLVKTFCTIKSPSTSTAIFMTLIVSPKSNNQKCNGFVHPDFGLYFYYRRSYKTLL